MVAYRRIPLEVGPFASQGDLLRFAMQLEAKPGILHIDLVNADLRHGRFIVHAPSAAGVALAISELSDFRVSSVVANEAISTRIHGSTTRAVQVFSPPAIAGGRTGGAWWQLGGIAVPLVMLPLVALAAVAGLFFSSTWGFSGLSASAGLQPTPTATAPPTETPPAVFLTPVVTSTPAPTATATAEASPVATAEPTSEAAATPEATATPAPTAEPTQAPPVVVATAPPAAAGDRYAGTVTGSLGSLVAANGCTWDTPFESDVELNVSRGSDGRFSGEATSVGTIAYAVTHTPSGAVCNPATVTTLASGSVGGSGTQVTANLSGDRQLQVTFSGLYREGELVGTVTVRRVLSTTSPFGNTSEVRTTTVTGVRLGRVY